MFRVSTHHVPGVHPSGSGCPPIMLPYYREGRARVSPDSTGGGWCSTRVCCGGVRILPCVSIFRVSTHQVPGVHPSYSGCPPIMLPHYREGRSRVSTHHILGVHPSCCPNIGRGDPGCPPIMLPHYREGRSRVSPDSTRGSCGQAGLCCGGLRLLPCVSIFRVSIHL